MGDMQLKVWNRNGSDDGMCNRCGYPPEMSL